MRQRERRVNYGRTGVSGYLGKITVANIILIVMIAEPRIKDVVQIGVNIEKVFSLSIVPEGGKIAVDDDPLRDLHGMSSHR